MSEPLQAIEFGTPGEMREWLVDLVLAGRKCATASLLAEWQMDGDALSEPGSRWAVLRTDGSRACVVEITAVRVAPLGDVDATFHADEGEGDVSRDAWIAGHERYWTQHVVPALQRHDPSFRLTRETPVVFERFRIVAAGPV
jgi:uncharacterized protein YhfF